MEQTESYLHLGSSYFLTFCQHKEHKKNRTNRLKLVLSLKMKKIGTQMKNRTTTL